MGNKGTICSKDTEKDLDLSYAIDDAIWPENLLPDWVKDDLTPPEQEEGQLKAELFMEGLGKHQLDKVKKRDILFGDIFDCSNGAAELPADCSLDTI